MAVETGARTRSAYDEWRDRRWRLTGLAFALLWLVTAVALRCSSARSGPVCGELVRRRRRAAR